MLNPKNDTIMSLQGDENVKNKTLHLIAWKWFYERLCPLGSQQPSNVFYSACVSIICVLMSYL